MALTLGDTVPTSYWTLVQWKPHRPHGPGLGMLPELDPGEILPGASKRPSWQAEPGDAPEHAAPSMNVVDEGTP